VRRCIVNGGKNLSTFLCVKVLTGGIYCEFV